MKFSKGFTLIELLIVVAIIGILAAIAIPNFLQAQVRAKVARAQSEIRNLSQAIEQYQVDNNAYPYAIDCLYVWYVTDALTTPIEYLSGASILIDPFRVGFYPKNPFYDRYMRYRYVNMISEECPGWGPCPMPVNCGTRIVACKPANIAARFREKHGTWRLSSAGPDKTASYTGGNDNFWFTDIIIYDPTNGTVSQGDIIRSQRYAHQTE